jgi:hypothetical protein
MKLGTKRDDEFVVLSYACKVIGISFQHDHEKEKNGICKTVTDFHN